MKKLRLTELEILDFIVGVCERNEITYFLVYGTLLGAVRHNGFIPWDDDIDICLLRNDYEKLISILKVECKNNKSFYFQDTCQDSEFRLPFSKVRKRGTVFLEDGVIRSDLEQGIFVDIFPLDKVRHKYGIQKIWSKLIYSFLGKAKNCNSRYYKLSKKLATWFENKNCKYLVSYGSAYPVERDVVLKEWFDDSVNLPFEGKDYSVPIGYKEYLRAIYGGNYMDMPPIEKRVTHNPKLIRFENEKGGEKNESNNT